MIDALLSFFAFVIAVALVALPLAIVIRIAIGIQTFMAVCKVRRHHEIRVDLCSLRRHLWRSNQYWIAEKMLATPLPFSRTRKVYLRKSCSPQYWDTFLGQQEIADAAKKNRRFRPILDTIVEQDSVPPARGKLVYHRTMLCSVKKPIPFKPALETITERRFLRVRRPGNGVYGPFLEYAYHTNNKSKQAPGVVDSDVVDSLVDDFDSSSELLVDPMFLADKSSEQEAAPKKVFSTTTSKKNKVSRMPRRSVRIAELLKTDKMGSIWKNGLRRSARLASL